MSAPEATPVPAKGSVPVKPPAPPSSRPERRRKNWRKILFRVHGWLGINLGLLLFVICFSGSIATLSNEIDWLLNPVLRVEAQDAPYAWEEMHASVAEAFPEGQNLGVYLPHASGQSSLEGAALAYVALPNGQTRKVYLNPYTGALQGHTSFFNTQRFFRTFHRRFFDGTRGIVIVTLTGFVLLAAAATGFLFYKGWLKQLFTLRRDKGPRLLWSDLHKTTGIWGLAFALLIALTGIFYFVEVGFQGADNYDALLSPPLPAVEEASLEAHGPQPELLPIDAYVERAEAAFPGLEVRSVRVPHRPDQPVYVDGQVNNPLTRDRANKVHLHPFTGEVIGIQRSAELSAVPFITDAVDPLHFGYFGGLITKVLWCIFGLMLSFSILAGTYLWAVRSGLVRRGRRAKEPLRLRPFPWLRGATVTFALTLAYFIVVLFATIDGIRGFGPQRAAPRPVAEAEVGPYAVRVDCEVPCRPEEEATFIARFQGAGLPNYRTATLGPEEGEAVEMTGPAYAPTAAVTAAPGEVLSLRIETWDGTMHEAEFSVKAGASEPERRRAAPEAAGGLPDTAPGVWWVVGAFAALVIGSIGGWFFMLIRAFRAVQEKMRRRRLL